MAKRRTNADGDVDERKWGSSGGSGIPAGSRGGGGRGGGNGIPAGSRGGGGMGGGSSSGIPAGSRGGGGGGGGNGIPAGSRGGSGGGGGSGIPAGSKPMGGGGGGNGIPAGSRGGGGGGGGSGIPAGSRGGGGGRGGSGIPAGSSVRGSKRGGSGVPAGSKSARTAMESKAEPGSGVVEVDDGKGIVEAYVSVTGIEDSVKDVIEPGAYEKTLQNRVPKGIWSHQWSEPVSKTLAIKEILPGDPSLPETLPSGDPWPSGAGALWVKTQFNLNTDVGRRAYENVKFFSDDADSSAWSIGYKTTKSHKDAQGVRHIKELDLYEYSPVLHGANKHAKTLSVKSFGEAMAALESGGYDTSAIEDEVKSLDATLPDPEGLTLAELKHLATARDVLDAYLDEVGYAVKRAAPVGDPDLEDPDESWLDDEGHDSSDADYDEEDVEVIPTLASRLEEVLQAESYPELLDAADAFDEAMAGGDEDAAGEAFNVFMDLFTAEEADDPKDVETWDELRDVVADTLDDAQMVMYGQLFDANGDPIDPDAEDADEEFEDDEDGEGVGAEDDFDEEGAADEADADEGSELVAAGKSMSVAEYKGIPKAERDKAAASGAALSDGSYPIRNHGELTSAIKLRSQGNAPNKVVDDHIKKRARALGKTHVLPEDLRDGGSDDASENPDGSKKKGTKSALFTLPPLDWAERAAFAVVPEIKF